MRSLSSSTASLPTKFAKGPVHLACFHLRLDERLFAADDDITVTLATLLEGAADDRYAPARAALSIGEAKILGIAEPLPNDALGNGNVAFGQLGSRRRSGLVGSDVCLLAASKEQKKYRRPHDHRPR